MSQSNFFDINRFTRLVINDVKINSRVMLISIAVSIVFWTLYSFGNAGLLDPSLYSTVLFIGGLMMTSRSFKDLHAPEVAYHYLTLPCSNFERFFSKWVVTSIGYAVALLILFCFYSVLIMAAHYTLFSHATPIVNLFDSFYWHSIKTYMVLHSIVFLGSIVFKRYCLLKTSLFIGCLFFVTGLFAGSISFHLFSLWTPFAVQITNFDSLVKIGFTLFWLAIAPFCWVVTYYRLKEYELG